MWKVLELLHHFAKKRGWAHKTSFTPPLFIEVPEPSQEIGRRTCIGALVISTLPLSTILIFDLGIVPTMWYASFSYFIIICFQIIHDRNVSLVSANAHIQ